MKTTLLLLTLVLGATHALRLPWQKKAYTPLLFFTLPKDENAECDALEECVKQVEKELGVRVERMDVLRDPPAQVLLQLLGSAPPLLYHRESCQVIRAAGPKAQPIRKARVVAWAKGRRLVSAGSSSSSSSSGGQSGNKVNTPVVVSKEDNALDQDELLQQTLTPLQRKGMEAIQKRTNSGSSSSSTEQK